MTSHPHSQPDNATLGPWEISEARTVEGEHMVVAGVGHEFGLIASCTMKADAELIVRLRNQSGVQITDERIAQLQYEAGMYRSLYENALKEIAALRAAPLGQSALATLLRQYASDLRRNSSGSDDYPWEWAKATADYLEILIDRASPVPSAGRGSPVTSCAFPHCSCPPDGRCPVVSSTNLGCEK